MFPLNGNPRIPAEYTAVLPIGDKGPSSADMLSAITYFEQATNANRWTREMARINTAHFTIARQVPLFTISLSFNQSLCQPRILEMIDQKRKPNMIG